MKLIALSKNGKKNKGKFFAMVDDSDFEWLNQWKWYAQKNYRTFYAKRSETVNGKRKFILMHRLILGLTDSKILSDHDDRNGLNNTRLNLRESTPLQNSRNRRKKLNGSSKYKGVYLHILKCSRKNIDGTIKQYSYPAWKAAITLNGKEILIGRFETEREAAFAYDAKAVELFGEFASLNF